MMSLAVWTLLVLLAFAVATDIHAGKVPNVLVLTGLAISLLLQAVHGTTGGVLGAGAGSAGFVATFGGIGVGFAALLPLYALRAMGAGDVKLMMMVGSFLGPLQTLGAVVLTFAAGGVLAVVMALWHRSFAQLAMNLRFMLTHGAVKAATGESMKLEPLQHTAGRLPYAVAIAAGTALQLLLVRSGGWALG